MRRGQGNQARSLDSKFPVNVHHVREAGFFFPARNHHGLLVMVDPPGDGVFRRKIRRNHHPAPVQGMQKRDSQTCARLRRREKGPQSRNPRLSAARRSARRTILWGRGTRLPPVPRETALPSVAAVNFPRPIGSLGSRHSQLRRIPRSSLEYRNLTLVAFRPDSDFPPRLACVHLPFSTHCASNPSPYASIEKGDPPWQPEVTIGPFLATLINW